MTSLPEIARACLTLILGLGVLYALALAVIVGMACIFPDHTRLSNDH